MGTSRVSLNCIWSIVQQRFLPDRIQIACISQDGTFVRGRSLEEVELETIRNNLTNSSFKRLHASGLAVGSIRRSGAPHLCYSAFMAMLATFAESEGPCCPFTNRDDDERVTVREIESALSFLGTRARCSGSDYCRPRRTNPKGSSWRARGPAKGRLHTGEKLRSVCGDTGNSYQQRK